MQRELDRLETGEIEDFETETGLKWSMERDEEEIAMCLNDLPSMRRKTSIIKEAFRSLTKQAQHDLAIQLALMIDDDAADPDLNASINSIDRSMDASSDEEF